DSEPSAWARPSSPSQVHRFTAAGCGRRSGTLQPSTFPAFAKELNVSSPHDMLAVPDAAFEAEVEKGQEMLRIRHFGVWCVDASVEMRIRTPPVAIILVEVQLGVVGNVLGYAKEVDGLQVECGIPPPGRRAIVPPPTAVHVVGKDV